LLDYRDAVFDNPVSISKIIIKFYHANTHWFNSCKFAIVSEKAKNIAISMIIKQADKGYRSEPFSNIEKAIEWLLSE